MLAVVLLGRVSMRAVVLVRGFPMIVILLANLLLILLINSLIFLLMIYLVQLHVKFIPISLKRFTFVHGDSFRLDEFEFIPYGNFESKMAFIALMR